MDNSILESIKKPLGLEDDAFDADVIMHINTAFVTLNQLGVGPSAGFSITDETTTWDEFLGTAINLEAVKTYVYIKVKIIFDPPTSSFVLDALNNQADQLEFRLQVQATPPPVVPVPELGEEYE